MKKVISLAAWRRPDYLKQVVNTLLECPEIDDYYVYISIDGGYPDRQEEMAKFLEDCGIKGNFVRQKNRLGCALNTYKALEMAFDTEDVEQVIHLEDDTIVAKDFLKYHEAALDYYRGNPNIFAIGSWHDNTKMHDPRETFFLDKFECLGWSTWRHIWDEVKDGWFGIHWTRDWVMEKNKNPKTPHPKGEDFLKIIVKHPTGSWAWPMNMYWRKDRVMVIPRQPRVFHIGREEGMFQTREVWDKRFKDKVWMGATDLEVPDSYIFHDFAED